MSLASLIQHQHELGDAREAPDDDEDWSRVRAGFVSVFVKELRERQHSVQENREPNMKQVKPHN